MDIEKVSMGVRDLVLGGGINTTEERWAVLDPDTRERYRAAVRFVISKTDRPASDQG